MLLVHMNRRTDWRQFTSMAGLTRQVRTRILQTLESLTIGELVNLLMGSVHFLGRLNHAMYFADACANPKSVYWRQQVSWVKGVQTALIFANGNLRPLLLF